MSASLNCGGLQAQRAFQGDARREILEAHGDRAVLLRVSPFVHGVGDFLSLGLGVVHAPVIVNVRSASKKVFAVCWNKLLFKLHRAILANRLSQFRVSGAAIKDLANA
jgi:hypothetical protein